MKDNERLLLEPTHQLANKIVFEAFKVLKESGGQIRGSEIIHRIEQWLSLNDWEKEKHEKTGAVRWHTTLRFYLIGCAKAGFLRRKKGIWYLTEDGEEAMNLGPEGLLDEYKKWSEKNKTVIYNETEEISEDAQLQPAALNELEDQALSGLRDFITEKNPYEFQDLVAALFRAMGYYTPFIAPKERSGGIDIVAFQDPLGAKSPRIKVQVKHNPDAEIAINEIQSLKELLNKEGDMGLFVTSGNFTADAEKFARDSQIRIKLIDFETFISLWQQFYSKLLDEEKNMLPLHPIYFLGNND